MVQNQKAKEFQGLSNEFQNLWDEHAAKHNRLFSYLREQGVKRKTLTEVAKMLNNIEESYESLINYRIQGGLLYDK